MVSTIVVALILGLTVFVLELEVLLKDFCLQMEKKKNQQQVRARKN